MMAAPSSTVIDAYSQGIQDLTVLAYRDLVDLIASSRPGGPEAVKGTLEQFLPQLIDQYGPVAVDLATEYYQEARLSAGVTTRFTPASTEWSADENRIQALIHWGVSPEFNQSTSTTEMLIGGGLQRLVLGGFRETVIANTGIDRTAYGVARKPQTGCCAFCAMLSTRVYASKEAALTVIGVERSAAGYRKRAKGAYTRVKRGKRDLGEKYHDFCRCSTVPVYHTGSESSDSWEDIKAVNPEAEKFIDAYTGARDDGTGKTSDVLSRMRQNYGFAR